MINKLLEIIKIIELKKYQRKNFDWSKQELESTIRGNLFLSNVTSWYYIWLMVMQGVTNGLCEHSRACRALRFFASTRRNKKFALRAYEQLQKFGEHEQASSRLNFASKSSKGKILRAVKNFNGPFIAPNAGHLEFRISLSRVLKNVTKKRKKERRRRRRRRKTKRKRPYREMIELSVC